MHRRLLPPAALVSVLMLTANVAARSFSDVQPGTGGYEALDSLSGQNIIQGYADGTFRPTQLVNRAEFLTILMRTLPSSAVTDDLHCFNDFRGTEQWYWQAACEGKLRGIVQGHPDGSFRGTDSVNFAEALAMSMRAWNVPLPQYFREPDHWYDPSIDGANSIHVTDYIQKMPWDRLTRLEVAILIDAFQTELAQDQCDGHALGENFPSPDGCNTCTCTENGPACTKKACINEPRCFSSDDCRAGQRCSTERGDCFPACDGNGPCIEVCAGRCELRPR